MSGFKVNEKGLIVPAVLRAVDKLDDATLYRFVGMPYGGPIDGLYDFHGTYFAPETDIGPMDRELPVFFEHGTFPEIEFAQMGTARIAQEDLMGRIFDVVVKKANEYHDFLERLYDEGILFGSAQAYVSGYQVDNETGKLLKFVPSEWSFTVTPSNILNRPIEVVRSIFNNVVPSFEKVERFYRMDNATEVQTPETTVPVNERIQEILGGTAANAAATGTTEAVQPEVSNEVLRAVIAHLRQANAEAAEFKQNIASVSEQNSALDARLDAIEQGLVLLAQTLQENVTRSIEKITADVQRIVAATTLSTALEMSEAEKEVMRRTLNTATPLQTGFGQTQATPAQFQQSNIPAVSIRPPGFGGN